MIRSKIIAVALVLCLVFCFCGMEAFAMNTGFSTSEIDPELQQTIISNVKLSYLSEEPRKNAISCFDVSRAKTIKYIFIFISVSLCAAITLYGVVNYYNEYPDKSAVEKR